MKIADAHVGQAVVAFRGTRLPATIVAIREAAIVVRFTDVTPATVAAIPTTHRGGLLGASLRPSAVTPAEVAS